MAENSENKNLDSPNKMADVELEIFERDILVEDIKRTLLFSTTDMVQFKSRSTDLVAQQRKFNKLQSKIEKALMRAKLFNRDEQLKIRNDFNDCYYAVLVQVDKQKQQEQETRRMSRCFEQSTSPIVENRGSRTLANLPLPTFNGNSEDWPTYIDLFKGQIHNNGAYTPAEKQRYLLLTLRDEPYNLVKSISICDENYSVVLDMLMETYDNRRIIASKYVDNILNIESFSKETNSNIRNLVHTYLENIKPLEKLQFPVAEWDFLLLNILLHKIPRTLRKRFEVSLHSPIEIPKIEVLINFLKKELAACDVISSQEIKRVSENFGNKQTHSQPSHSNHVVSLSHRGTTVAGSAPRASYAVSTDVTKQHSLVDNNRNSLCMCCGNGTHTLSKCTLFLNKQPNDRFDFVKSKKICINCLHFGHELKTCKSTFSCRTCNNKHHTLLHFNNNNNCSKSHAISLVPTTRQSESLVPSTQVEYVHTTVAPSITALTTNHCIMLSTALVDVGVGKSKSTIRCLIDTGSQASFIAESCAQRLGLSRRFAHAVPVVGIGEARPIFPKGKVTCTLSPYGQTQPAITVDALILPKLVSQTPRIPVPTDTWPHVKNLILADPSFNSVSQQPIEMILGADVLSEILLGNIVKGLPDQPIAMNSIFGFLLMGKVSFNNPSPIQVCHSSFFEDNNLQRFWELESFPEQRMLTPDEKLCENIFVNTHSRDTSGRYIVSLPFKADAPSLGESRDIALSRFRKLEFRLEKDSSLKANYHSCLQEYLDLDQMELCSPPSDNLNHYYIPHHCVVKESSETSKTRVVFDAGCKSANNISLNDTLLTGPKLHTDIIDILLNFRIFAIVFTADIKQMYRNILVRESDRDFQRIVWRPSPDEPIRDYRLRTVTFGVSSSPYLALRTIRQLAHDEAERFPLASKVLMRQVFVDDILSGAETISNALVLQKQLIDICKTAGFELRKWHSNSSAVLEAVTSSHGGRCTDLVSLASLENDKQTKVLGLQWNPVTDVFNFNIQVSHSKCTKRFILSEIAKIYDPLGFLSPVILYAKHLIQLLWLSGCGWDEQPPLDIINAWSNYVRELPLLSQCEFPRHIFSSYSSVEIHGFADASEKGFAATVYIRCINQDQSVKVFLVLAKSRVAPLKKLSIPRLELMGALLLSKLINKVMLAYGDHIKFDNVFAYSDSKICLFWISSPPHEWKTFVSNRTSEILSLVPASCWYHVSSADNPADAASRGMTPSSFIKHQLWFRGPMWLTLDRSVWPTSNKDAGFQTTEEKKSPLVLVNSISSEPVDDIDSIIVRFSSLGKLIRVVSYIFRFYNKCRKTSNSYPNHLTVPEYTYSLNKLVYLVQHKVFSENIDKLKKGERPTPQFKRLAPFLDENTYLRVAGRLRHAPLAFESKHQLILPKKHHLTSLIIDDCHVINAHAGPQTVHNLLLQKYWILSARDIIRQRIHKCINCFRTKPIRPQPSMGNLPAVRLRGTRAFLKVAVDMCGYFYVRANKVRNAKIIKSYVAVFVCMSVKAIHLELVSDLSTESFLAAFRRFISRRGICTDVFSDNGTNFVGCNNQLKELFEFLRTQSVQDILQDKTLQQNITWHFHPPTGSHFAGLVEAGVKSFKSHLYRVIGARTQTYDEMHTLLCQIEAVLNSRPLCVLSADVTDPLPLTPSHFLIGEPITALPDISLVDTRSDRLTRWHWVQQAVQHFWKRWSKEYLHELQQIQKWFFERGTPIREGMVVVVCDDNAPPLQWRMARVHELHPGSDGISRVVTIKLGNSFVKRPVVKLCPLPIE